MTEIEDATNILLFLPRDLGFAAPTAFGGPVSIEAYDRFVKNRPPAQVRKLCIPRDQPVKLSKKMCFCRDFPFIDFGVFNTIVSLPPFAAEPFNVRYASTVTV